MNSRTLRLLVCAAFVPALTAFKAPPAATLAPPPPPAIVASALPTGGAVAAVYNQFRLQPIWFRGGVVSPAAIQLGGILRRAQVEGLSNGAALAADVEAAIGRARSGNPADLAAAEQLLSSAWVMYVQTIKAPTPGMIYAFPVLKPQGGRTDQILLAAASAPSLEQHLLTLTKVNPIYSAIRDAEWARVQSTGAAPDPRVIVNLARARSIPSGGRFVLVDSASQRLFLYENGVPVDSMKVIVGMGEGKQYYLPTPLIASVMYYTTFNPYWNAPAHLIKNAIAPKTIAGGMKYFNSMGYEVMADWSEGSATVPASTIDWKAVAAGTVKLRIRQKPSKDNFMGTLKFPFPNPEDIYLHDTPAKDKFALSDRAISNGCVRLEDARRFGRWLLGREPVAPGPQPEIRVPVPNPVPIYLTYLTAQPKDGQITFLKDVYGWDKPASQVATAATSGAPSAQP